MLLKGLPDLLFHLMALATQEEGRMVPTVASVGEQRRGKAVFFVIHLYKEGMGGSRQLPAAHGSPHLNSIWLGKVNGIMDRGEEC